MLPYAGGSLRINTGNTFGINPILNKMIVQDLLRMQPAWLVRRHKVMSVLTAADAEHRNVPARINTIPHAVIHSDLRHV